MVLWQFQRILRSFQVFLDDIVFKDFVFFFLRFCNNIQGVAVVSSGYVAVSRAKIDLLFCFN